MMIQKENNANQKRTNTFFILGCFLFLHVIISLPLAYYLNIWMDEASTLNTTKFGFFEAFRNTIRDEKQAPLYFWIISLWRGISSSIFFARLFSIICSLFAIGLFYRLVKNLWNAKIAVYTAFFFALHPYLFWASLEIRVYSLTILLTVLLLNLFFDGFLCEFYSKFETKCIEETSIKIAKFLFPFIAIVSLYTNYYLGFLLVGCFIVLLLQLKFSESKTYFLQMLLTGLLFLPMVWAIKMQLSVRNSGYFDATNFIEGIRLLWGHFLMLVLPTEIFPTENITTISYLRLWAVRILIILIAGVLIKKRKLFDVKIFSFASMCVVIFGFLYLSYFILGGAMLEIRHVAVLFVPMMLLLISIFISISPENSKYKFYYFASIGVILVSFYSYGLFSLHPNLIKRGDWINVSNYIELNENENQTIFIFPHFQSMSLPFYYDGKNNIKPNGNFHDWFPEAEFGSESMWKKQIEYYISIFSEDSDEIWILTYLDCHRTKACMPLEKYVNENYNVVKQKDFYEERVRLLRKK